MISPDLPASSETRSAVSSPSRTSADVRGDHPSALAPAGPRIVAPADLSAHQRDAARRHFVTSVFPALTPLAVDPRHPFPHLRSRSLNVAVSLLPGRGRGPAAPHLLAVVQVPALLPRLVRLPSSAGGTYALLEDLIAASASDLFPGHAVGETAVFRVTRSPEVDGREGGSGARRRHVRGEKIRLEISAGASSDLEAALAAALKIERCDVLRITGPLQAADLVAAAGS